MAHFGECFCGAVRVEARGEPELMGYCHCAACRGWSAAPVTAFSLWLPERVSFARGEEYVTTFRRSSESLRMFCDECSGRLLVWRPAIHHVEIPAPLLRDLRFMPAVHLHYAQTIFPMLDGLPKMKDLPAELGGGGECVAADGYPV